MPLEQTAVLSRGDRPRKTPKERWRERQTKSHDGQKWDKIIWWDPKQDEKLTTHSCLIFCPPAHQKQSSFTHTKTWVTRQDDLSTPLEPQLMNTFHELDEFPAERCASSLARTCCWKHWFHWISWVTTSWDFRGTQRQSEKHWGQMWSLKTGCTASVCVSMWV